MSWRPLLRTVATRVVRPEWAARVVSPAYDSLRPQDRRALMDRDEFVFLHVTRSPGEGEDLTAEELGHANAAALQRLLDANLFTEIQPAGLYIYRLIFDEHVQCGVVGDIALQGFSDGRIRPHERVRPQRTELLADHLHQVGINSSPVALGYRDDPRVDAIVRRIIDEEEPLVDFQREDRIGQTVWAVPAANESDLADLLANVTTYIVDGHHRVAAANELWDRAGHGEAGSHVLGALFPIGQLRVCAFHRRVADLNGQDPVALIAAIEERGFTVNEIGLEVDPTPAVPGHFGLYVDHQWYRVAPVGLDWEELDDATLLQDRILGPLLGVDEAGADRRLDYLPGNAGVAVLVAAVDAHGGVAFALHPMPLDQLMAVSDRGETLPPKSTYFEPKVRSGVFVSPRLA